MTRRSQGKSTSAVTQHHKGEDLTDGVNLVMLFSCHIQRMLACSQLSIGRVCFVTEFSQCALKVMRYSPASVEAIRLNRQRSTSLMKLAGSDTNLTFRQLIIQVNVELLAYRKIVLVGSRILERTGLQCFDDLDLLAELGSNFLAGLSHNFGPKRALCK